MNNLENWQYYRNNSNGQSVQYDGLTSDLLGVKKSLTARADVTPCNTYHLKLAIADRGDSVYDSGVFISELKGGTPSALVQYNSGIDYLIENCTSTPDDVIIKLSNALEDSITYNIIVGGTAVNGVDYLMEIPSSITFAPGETEASFSIMPLTDLEEEAVETVEISLVNNFGCGDVVYTTLVVELHDELNIEINAGQDTAFVCQDSSLVLEVVGASDYFWTPLNIVSSPTSNTPSVSPPESQWVHVEGRIGNVCVDYDSIFLQIVDPEILAVALDPANICEGDSVKLQVTDNVNHSNLFWSPGDFISDPNSSLPVVKPPVTTSYIASVDVAGCIVRDTITVNVDPFDFPEITTLDTLICQNYSVILAEYIDTAFTSTTFEWTPADYLDDAFASGPLATPEVTTTYTLTATSENGYCSQTSSINIEVLPAVVDIQHPDTVEICLGESIDLFVETSTGGLHLSWFPSDSLSNTTETTVAANPTISTWYYTSLDVGECSVIDSVYVRVDSLPLLDIMAEPEKETYCEGEIITLFSNAYEPAHFSDIENLWIPETGTESPLEDWNLVLRGVEPLTYQRITTNHACVDTAEIFLDIVVTNELDITPDTLICLGESIQLNVSSPDTDEFEWSPEEGLSCIECADPIASPSNTTVFQVSADVRGCPVSGNVSIQVNTPPIFGLPSQTIICFGESIQLNNAFDPGATYTWTSSDPTFGTLTDPMPVVTPTQNASYTVVAVNQYCPPEEREIEVVVVDQATLSVSEDVSVCVGDPVTLSAEGSDPGSYFWNTGENTSSITAYPGQTMTFIISYTYGNNCGTLVDSIEVVVFENFDLEISTEPPERTIQQGQSVQLMAVTSLDNPESASYEWIENEILLSEFTTSNANVTPVDPVTVYEVTVISDVGCVNSAAIEFIVIPPTWKMPNVFTPDGVNKNFNILYVGDLEILDFSIFNRWGAVVYDNEDPSNGWNGNYKGNPAPSAVYIYVIKLRLPDGTEEILKGDVTLLR
ncbi:MAG: T9SS type B sorting domain-containing protein [Bacteroidetes bacterium]|nr:T9SS type B sorting domain-containing protein [Bacteroidota bacterium]